MYTLTKEQQSKITPAYALEILKEGNWRFEQNLKSQRDLKSQVYQTKDGQFPFAAILSCIDSRVPAETIFDQGIGDIFSARVAGNIINDDILGSLEYACKVAGSKIIVVLGHTKCGAVTAACENVELGNITTLLDKIKPAVNKVDFDTDNKEESIEKVTIENVKESMRQIHEKSEILDTMEKNEEILIVGAVYNVAKGRVTFLD